jgi:hypothetical protein
MRFLRKIVFQEWSNINVTFERREDEEYTGAGIELPSVFRLPRGEFYANSISSC